MLNPSSWILLSFVILIAISGKKVWITLSQILDNRALKIHQEIDNAIRSKIEAEAYLRQVYKLKKYADSQIAEINKKALQDIKNLQKTSKQEVEKFIESEQHHLEFHKKMIEHRAYEKIEQALIPLSIKVAEQFIVDHLRLQTETFLFEKAVEKIQAHNFNTQLRS